MTKRDRIPNIPAKALNISYKSLLYKTRQTRLERQ
jgi:hypothetical protein